MTTLLSADRRAAQKARQVNTPKFETVSEMIQRRAKSAGITTRVGNHTFRATGVTAYLKNGGTLEKAAQMANHASTRTTQLYDRRAEEVTLDEVERVLI